MTHRWITVADGDPEYWDMASTLARSGRRFGLKVEIYTRAVLERLGYEPFHPHPQILKLYAIRDACADADRVTFVDADCVFVRKPCDIEQHEGCVKEKWERGDRFMVSDDTGMEPGADLAFDRLIRHEFPDMVGTTHRHRDWNGGVITGESEVLMALCDRWEHWMKVLLNVAGGRFRSDQAGMRLAYFETFFRQGRGDLPPQYNWIVKRWGFGEGMGISHAPCILHRAGLNSSSARTRHRKTIERWEREATR